MTSSATCAICKSANRTLAVRLLTDGGMSPMAIGNTIDGGIAASTIERHLKLHQEAVVVKVDSETARSARERVLALQTLQLDEFERRIHLAKERADELNSFHKDDTPDEWRPVDWSEFIDILGKDMQAAIGSILKSQGISDKRDKAQGDLKLGLFEAMARTGGLAPASISGAVPLQLDVSPDAEQED